MMFALLCCARMQVIATLSASLTARGIGVVTSDGTPMHIDFLEATPTETREQLSVTASKVYLDWYMLTQVRATT
jgi:ribose/xylose/arabinose/galactoside ABC-type transport system permease subunit